VITCVPKKSICANAFEDGARFFLKVTHRQGATASSRNRSNG
jgi:hypothetical protein